MKENDNAKSSEHKETLQAEWTVVSLGEHLLKGTVAQQEDILTLAEKLIEIYDRPFLPLAIREQAARIVERLATQNEGVLEMVIANAECYVRHQRIDDSFPWFPNSLDLLFKISRGYERVTSFFRLHPEYRKDHDA